MIEHGSSSSSESEAEENKPQRGAEEENVILDSDTSSLAARRGQKQTKRLTRSRVKNSPRVKSRSNGLKNGPSSSSRNQPKNHAKSSSDDEVLVPNRTCPVKGCDSKLHISGKGESHFLVEACPLYHNIVGKADDPQKLRERINADRARLERFDDPNDYKEFLHKRRRNGRVLDRKLAPPAKKPNSSSVPEIGREPQLNRLGCSQFDLNLFREAQAKAAEKEEVDQHLGVGKLQQIQFGRHEYRTWYQAPYPSKFHNCSKLFICHLCLEPFKCDATLRRHISKCELRSPPGIQLYVDSPNNDDNQIAVYEVDGTYAKAYCRNLCLLSKLFLDSKTMFYDVEPFWFYILIERKRGDVFTTVGYFSKEKNPAIDYNLSCIMVLPAYMGKGYGKFLIDLSYALSRQDGILGSPERPLSDLGLISYRSYWKDVIVRYILTLQDDQKFSIRELSLQSGILQNDLVSTLQYMQNIKYWRGKHIILFSPSSKEQWKSRLSRQGLRCKPEMITRNGPNTPATAPPSSSTS